MRNRAEPMPVKYWSRAGLMLTWWCNARCASCYLCCSPDRHEWMEVDDALCWWEQLIAASPHGCRIHLTGGEPFGDWPRLADIALRARRAGLGPLEKVETNGFWARDVAQITDRLRLLDEAGMEKLSISADPYHQQFVPIGRVRLLARVAAEVLGAARVQVRWADWLAEGFDTDALSPARRAEVFAAFGQGGRDRLAGRAATCLAGRSGLKTAGEFVDNSCHDALLRSKHVHVGPGGELMPGTCGGIVLGRLDGGETVSDIWRSLNRHGRDMPVLGPLARGGPMELAAAEALDVDPRQTVASKCELCWLSRRRLRLAGRHEALLGPGWMYREESVGFGNKDGEADVQ
jgi:hypothetical protein